MSQADLLDQAKTVLGVETDYALGQRLDISRMRVSDYRAGRRKMDEYACFRIAEVLGKSPSEVIAEVMAANEKNEDKRLYFQRFFMIAALWITLGLPWPLYSGSYGSAYAAGEHAESRANSTFQPLCEVVFEQSTWVNPNTNAIEIPFVP